MSIGQTNCLQQPQQGVTLRVASLFPPGEKRRVCQAAPPNTAQPHSRRGSRVAPLSWNISTERTEGGRFALLFPMGGLEIAGQNRITVLYDFILGVSVSSPKALASLKLKKPVELVLILTLSPTALGPIWPMVQRLTAQSIKELKKIKKLQLSDIILRLFYYNINLHILPSLTAISFQSQNLCHNKSTQRMGPQRSDLASVEGGITGGMTHRV